VRLCESAGVDPLWIGGRSKKWIEIVRVNIFFIRAFIQSEEEEVFVGKKCLSIEYGIRKQHQR